MCIISKSVKMKFKVLFSVLFALTLVSVSAQENTAILCADGMDNDGDGLTDCQDPDCQTFPTQGCATCFEDGLSFADYIIDYSPECPDNLTDQYMVASDALGVPDNDPTDGTPGGLGAGRVTLGEGGSITVGFSNNLVTNTGNNDPDVWVFEVGSDIEGTTLDFRPFDAATTAIMIANGIPDVDGDGFYEFGAIGGSTAFIDLDAVVSGLAFGEIKFDAIKLTDILDNQCVMPTSGADIDGICALSSLPQEVCGNGIDDDGDGLIDCDDTDLIGTCCCLDPDEIDLGPDAEVCPGESILLDAGPGFVSYLWQDGSTTESLLAEVAQEYSVIAIDSCMNEVVDTFFLSISLTDTTLVDLAYCKGDSVEYNGVFYSSPGFDEQNFTGGSGCDSVILITIEENITFEILFNFEICQGDTVSLNNINYTEVGSYEQNLQTVEGCDSTLSINIEFDGGLFEDVEFDICEGDTINFQGVDFFESGLFQLFIESDVGCDTTYTIRVNGLQPSTTNEFYTICEGESVEVNDSIYNTEGTFEQFFQSSNGCDSTLVINVEIEENSENQIEFNLCNGGTVEVNSETYTESGLYTQNLTAANGCDSLLLIQVNLSEIVLNYDFDDCQATIVDGANANYSEFDAKNISVLDCGTIEANNVYREDPEVNIHSCTPGVNDTPAMCVSSIEECDFIGLNSKAVVFKVTLSPNPGESMGISCFDFYEKAPPMFDWLGGNSGPNNFPLFYDITVISNGNVIYNLKDNPTEEEWNQESYNFVNNPDFNVVNTTTFEFRLTAYCQTDNGSPVSAWDLDEISISAQCGGTNRVISGRMHTEEGVAVQQVQLTNEAPAIDLFDQYTTMESGEYSFVSNPLYQDYTLKAEKNTDYMEGVSTLDLLLIQKHILGLSKFDSPYKMIAADITNDQNISALDLVYLRKVILGIELEFPNNDSWRFVTNDSDITLENPWNFKEEFFFEYLSKNLTNQDMTAVKIGDVNGSINNIIGDMSLESRTENSTLFNLKNQYLKKGETTIVSFSCSNDLELSGVQMMLETNGVELKTLNSKLSSFSTSHFNIMEDECRIAWNDIHTLNQFKANEIVLGLQITATKDIWLSDALELSSERTSEIYSQDGNKTSLVELRFIDESIGDLQLYQNYPNPFSTNTTIGFNLDKEGMVQFNLMNIEGKVLYSKKDFFNKGNQEISIGSDDIQLTKGVLFYQLEFEGNQITKRMVRL